MNLVLLAASILLAAATGWSLALLQRLRDWRAVIVVLWLGAMLVLLSVTIRGQFGGVDTTGWFGTGPVSQSAIAGVAVAAALFFHYVFQHDALTGLPSRPLFLKRIALAQRRLRKGRLGGFAVLSVDLDRFKVVADGLGHETADEFLRIIGMRLRGTIRPGDVVARFGGDQFAFLVTGVDRHQALLAAERVHQVMERPVVVDGQEVVTSASIGIVVAPAPAPAPAPQEGRVRPTHLLRQADLARARAKASGQSRHEVYDESMHHLAIERLRLEADLRRALERQEFCLQYQPIVSLQGKRLEAFEALLRWRHPSRGLVMPDQFIGLAEDTGLVRPIGAWVLEEVCRQVTEWRSAFEGARDLVVHVNISAGQFADADLVGEVEEILRRQNAPPEALGLEITESVVMGDAEGAAETLARLRKLGVKLQIDDFGTGYSSLSYLSRFPVDTLKIDRSFVMQMRKNGDNVKIVRSIISLARDLELGVIAEGVERPNHVRQLIDFGCQLGQGKHLGVPLDPPAAEQLVARLADPRIHQDRAG
jgi:diguanylate cyclase (GGDEF)-like protein